jgi:hypothetical protein
MEKKQKKKYATPKLTRVRLDSQVAVMAACKFGSTIGPGVSGCEPLTVPCSEVSAS